MKNTNLFEVAARGKYRFPYKGLVSVEDLWDISLEGLDSIFKTLNKEVKVAEEESLLNTKSEADEILSNKIEIVKYIVSVKLAEREARHNESVKAEKRQKILEIMAAKQNEALHNSSIEELEKMLEDLK